jgi:hypothetical protein
MTAVPREVLNQAKRLGANVPGIQGVDFGVLYRNGRSRGRRLGIRFHIKRKLPLNELAGKDLLPAQIGGFPCDVIEASYEPHAASTFDVAARPQPGISVGNVLRQTTGSIGGFVRDTQTGATCLLSNWHVLCGSTAAVVDERISQPGPRHLGTQPERPIGRLLRWSDLSHGIDAAVAAVGSELAIDLVPLGLQAPSTEVSEPEVGMRVVKSGVVTGVTHALVDGVDGSFPMNYGAFGDTQRWMDGIRLVVDPQMRADEISLSGDSGAVWIDIATGRAVALHFAGEDGLGPLAEYALAHPLLRVLSSLHVEWISSLA